jgi:hypothetical protein
MPKSASRCDVGLRVVLCYFNDCCSLRNFFEMCCIQFALWNPDKGVKYDLTRVQNEFEMIKDVASFDPCPVITPYHCVDVVDEENNSMKLLVTAWSRADEQVRSFRLCSFCCRRHWLTPFLKLFFNTNKSFERCYIVCESVY